MKATSVWILCILSYLPILGFSQTIESTHVFGLDSQNFQEAPSYSSDVGRQYNMPEYYDHPDFGKLTFDAPEGKNVVEDISKRKSDERYYVDLDDPLFFYIEKSAVPINFFDGEHWRAIDPSLHPSGNGKYNSGYQPYPTALNTHLGFTSFDTPGGEVSFNNFKLQRIYNDNSSDVIEPNWSQVTVDNFGCHVVDIFPGIDLKLKFSERRIKGDFIIKYDLNLKSIVFIDQLGLPSNYAALIDNTSDLDLEYVEIYDMNTSENVIVIDPARSHDSSGNKESWFCDYEIVGSDLHIIVDSSQLNNSASVYPLTIDPTFVAVGPVASGFPVSGSLIYPAACTDVINLVFPGGSTPWDANAAATTFSDFCAITVFFPPTIDCWASELGFWVTSGCGGNSPAGAPGTTWGCTAPACDAPGGWILSTTFNASGTQSLAQCYAPSCAAQNMSFTINFTRSWCPTYTIYDDCVWANSYCESLDDWSITLQGRTVETLGNTATGNGSQNIFDADCAGTQTLDPTPLYGVGPYTYSWSTGGSGSTEIVPGTVGTYTCDVTDACGTTVTATFDIGCPLSIDLQEFSAHKVNQGVSINWESFIEVDILSYEIQHSTNGEEWRTIGVVQAVGDESGGNSYTFVHNQPTTGKNYYRLNTALESGSFEFSETAEVDFYPAFELFPNPAEHTVTIAFEQAADDGLQIVFVDALGREALRTNPQDQKTLIDLTGLSAGNYIVSLIHDGSIIEYQRLVIAK